MSRIVYIRAILGLYRDNGKENGNYYSRLGLYGVFVDTLVQNIE